MGRRSKRKKLLLRQHRLLGIELDPQEARRVGLGHLIEEQEKVKARRGGGSPGGHASAPPGAKAGQQCPSPRHNLGSNSIMVDAGVGRNPAPPAMIKNHMNS